MSLIETATAIEQYRERCEDRVHVINDDERTVIVVADGAGGIGEGDVAAELFVKAIASNYSSIHSASGWVNLLTQIDHQIGCGESTGVVVDVRPYGIAGASVGDSQAWIIDHDNVNNLTKNQLRKPLLGSGAARVTEFIAEPLSGLLVVATDGFFDYAKRDDIIRLLAQSDFYEAPRKCIESVRLPSGDMWDDVGIVIGRNKPRATTRRRYTI